ncbi:hypothetical protein ACFQ69_16250 [Streptomyces sp. NPDC056470]|uniref:hypothetical protein n=1 Tax=Streptomyces sp. NPDC056470 TaxID=3345831 RepID=UPI0036B1CA7D
MQESPSSDEYWLVGSSLEELERLPWAPEAAKYSPNHWEQLRDMAVGRMQSPTLSQDIRIRWGRLALVAVSRKGKSRTSQETVIDSSHVRAYMIQKFGASTTDEARNLSRLCSDISQSVGMPLEAVTELAEDWRSAPRETLLTLRRIKNMLTPLLPLRTLLAEGDAVCQETRAWLDILPKLP